MASLPQDVATDLAQENAQLRAELGAVRDRQAATAEILRTIASTSGDAGRALQQIAETSARLFGAPSVSIQLVRDGEWAGAYRFGDSAQRVRAAVPLTGIRIGGRNMPGAVVGQNRQIHIPDLDHLDPEFADFPGLPHARAAGTRTMCGTPLRLDGNAIGVLIVYRDRLLPFTEEELALQQSFADQAVIAIENARLFNETGEALERQTATSDILKVIASSPSDVQPVFDVIVERAVRLCGARMGRVYRYDGNLIQLVGGHGLSVPGRDSAHRPFPRPASDDTIVGRVLLSRRPYILADLNEDKTVPPLSRQMITAIGARSQVTMPMLLAGEPIGAITLSWAEPRGYTDQQIAMLQTFADQAVIAIENARLFEEVQARTRELSEALTYQTGSSKILSVIASSPTDVAPVLKAIVESACELCEADDAVVASKEGNDLVFKEQHGSVPVLWDRQPISRDWAAGRAVIDRKPVHVHDLLSTEGEQFPDSRGFALRTGVRTILSVPLLREHESIGSIVLRRTECKPFSQRQIRLLQTFADQAVIAIGNVRLFDEVRARTKELSQSLDNLRTAQDRLVQTEKLASLGQLTAGIAHEIKNPLNFVNNFSALSAELTDELNEVLKQSTLSDTIRNEVNELTTLLKENLEKVVQHGKRADSIVKNMLLHSREGSGEHRSADINAILDESLNLAYHGARAEKPQFNVTLHRDFDAMAGMIDVFPQEMTRVFLNLISNGFYAVTKRKTEKADAGFEPALSVATRNLGDAIEIRIRDNGTGIPADVKEKMFNPFFTTKPAGEGTGLGLSMSHDIIVKQHGGRIEVLTEAGEFTEFKIVLPRAKPSAQG
jgi:two-component system NtrC family sensor kinase